MSDRPVLDVEDLKVYFYTDDGIVRAVDGVSFQVFKGETLGIVGESGCGKTVTAMSVMRLVAEPGRVVNGAIRFNADNILTMSGDELRHLRGGSVAMICQDPMTSLNPVLRVGWQVEEAMVTHGRFSRVQAGDRAVDLLTKMGLSAPRRAVREYPHQLSGGMRQRVMLAMGFSNEPSLIIADEPTTALDVTIQAQILDLLRELNTEYGAAIVLISHDLGVVANLCSRIVVMYAGELVEEGPTDQILRDPRHPYTWALINAIPRLDRPGEDRLVAIEGTPPDLLAPPPGCRFADRCPFRIERCAEHPALEIVGSAHRTRCWVTQSGVELPRKNGADSVRKAAAAVTASVCDTVPSLELKNVVKHFPISSGLLGFGEKEVVHAVDGVDLTLVAGETVGLVGESGCGKSTIARLIVRLYEPTSGEIWFEGRNISHLAAAEMRPLRRRMQMIFQDPYSSLNSRMKVGEILTEPLRVHGLTDSHEAGKARAVELLGLVGISPRALDQYPHEFSGGQRQRIGIARALAVDPRFVILDEPISSLDVNIQAQVINLLKDLQRRLGLTYLFISHNLAVVRHLSDRIAVLYLGKIMEIASNRDLFAEPLHPYTQSLISAAPVPEAAIEQSRQRIRLFGEIPSAVHPPSGCRFRTRCPIAQPVCAEQVPPLAEHRPGHWAACHFAGAL